MCRVTYKIIFFGAIVFLLSPLPVDAQYYLHSGRLELHPALRSSFTHTDNLFQQAEGTGENIIEVSPGIGINFPTRHHLFRAAYSASIYSLQDQSITKVKHSATGTADLNFPGGMYLRLSDTYAERIYPSLPEEVGITEHWDNQLLADLGYKSAGRFCLCFGYRLNMLAYPEPPSNVPAEEWIAPDRDTHSGELVLTLRALVKLSVITELWYGMVNYKESLYASDYGYDASFIRAFLGVGGRLSPKTIFSLKTGYEQRSYENENIDPAQGLVLSFSLIEKFSPRFNFELNASRSIHESISGTSSHYVSTGGGGSLFFRPITLVSIGTDIRYDFLSYPTGGREDTLMTVSPRLKFHILRWLEAGAGFSLRKRDSNVETGGQELYDYQENRISVSVGAVL